MVGLRRLVKHPEVIIEYVLRVGVFDFVFSKNFVFILGQSCVGPKPNTRFFSSRGNQSQ